MHLYLQLSACTVVYDIQNRCLHCRRQAEASNVLREYISKSNENFEASQLQLSDIAGLWSFDDLKMRRASEIEMICEKTDLDAC